MLKEKTKSPDFELINQDDKRNTLSDYKGKWVVLYFYPKDNSPGCTREAANFRDNIKRFEKLNTVVVGISPDSPESHKKFIDKYNLPLILLSDPKKEVIEKYGAKGIITKRISYLIDPKGIIKKAYAKVNPARHAEEILNDIENIVSKLEESDN